MVATKNETEASISSVQFSVSKEELWGVVSESREPRISASSYRLTKNLSWTLRFCDRCPVA